MDLHDFLRTRRSVRRHQQGRIPNDVVERILTTATYAPSAHNRQPWRFAVVSAEATKSALADGMAVEYRRDLVDAGMPDLDVQALTDKSRMRIQSAPLAIVLCMDSSDMDVYPDARRAEAERTMALQSAANAGLTLLLAAHAEGLGAVWNCSPLFAPVAVRTALGLPQTWEPQALFLIGRPAESPEPGPRKPLNAIAIFA